MVNLFLKKVATFLLKNPWWQHVLPYHSDANPIDTNSSDTNPSDTNPSDTNSSDTNLSDTNPSDTNPRDTNLSDPKCPVRFIIGTFAYRPYSCTLLLTY